MVAEWAEFAFKRMFWLRAPEEICASFTPSSSLMISTTFYQKGRVSISISEFTRELLPLK